MSVIEKQKLLISDNDKNLFSVIYDPAQLSKSKKYIKFGSYFSDELFGWYRVAGLKVVEILDVADKEGSFGNSNEGSKGN